MLNMSMFQLLKLKHQTNFKSWRRHNNSRYNTLKVAYIYTWILQLTAHLTILKTIVMTVGDNLEGITQIKETTDIRSTTLNNNC